MQKFEQYGALAEKYYVEKQYELSQIAKELNISSATLKSWKNKGDWDSKRQTFLSSQYTCYSALQELLMYISKDALSKIKVGEVPEAASLNFIAKMAEKLPKMKELETTPIKQNNTSDIAKLIDERLVNG